MWTGYDNSLAMSASSSNDETAISKTMWKAVMQRIHENLPNEQFPTPSGIVQIEICTQSGKLPVPGLCDGHTRHEYFEEGTEPTESCTIHYSGSICAYDNLPASPDCPFAYQGVSTFPLAEEEALISGSTMIIENPDGTQNIIAPNSRTYCQHDAAFYANPDFETILAGQQWEMNQNGVQLPDNGGDDDDDD